MPRYRNDTKAVINIGGHTVIAPTKSGEVDPKLRGVQRLIDDKKLVLIEDEGNSGGDAQAGAAEVELRTAKQFKAALDKLEVPYAGNASTDTLKGLYEAKMAELTDLANSIGSEQ